MRGAKILTSPYLEPHFTLFNIIKSLLGRIAFPRKTKEYSISRVAKTLLSLKTRCFPLLSPCFPLAFPQFTSKYICRNSTSLHEEHASNTFDFSTLSLPLALPWSLWDDTVPFALARADGASGRRGRTARANGATVIKGAASRGATNRLPTDPIHKE